MLTEHVLTDVNSHPEVACLSQHLTTEPTPTAVGDIEYIPKK